MSVHRPLSESEFPAVAGAVLSGTASPEESARLQQTLADSPALQREFTEIAEIAAHMAATRPTASPSAERSIAAFHQWRHQQSSASPQFTAPRALPDPPSHPHRTTGTGKTARLLHPAWLALPACLAILGGIAYFKTHDPSVPTIAAAMAPRGVTGFTAPSLVWTNEPGRDYDVWILPPTGDVATVPALYKAEKKRSPLAFSDLRPAPGAPAALQPGQDYRLLVCVASLGRHAGVAVPFSVASSPGSAPDIASGDPSILMEHARAHLAAGRPADALMYLTALPPAAANSPEASALRAQATAALP
jgi:hypothetical protein